MADRAEHVAWTGLRLTLDDAPEKIPYKRIFSAYLRELAPHLAEHELTRERTHAEATRKAAEIMAEGEAATVPATRRPP